MERVKVLVRSCFYIYLLYEWRWKIDFCFAKFAADPSKETIQRDVCDTNPKTAVGAADGTVFCMRGIRKMQFRVPQVDQVGGCAWTRN